MLLWHLQHDLLFPKQHSMVSQNNLTCRWFSMVGIGKTSREAADAGVWSVTISNMYYGRDISLRWSAANSDSGSANTHMPLTSRSPWKTFQPFVPRHFSFGRLRLCLSLRTAVAINTMKGWETEKRNRCNISLEHGRIFRKFPQRVVGIAPRHAPAKKSARFVIRPFEYWWQGEVYLDKVSLIESCGIYGTGDSKRQTVLGSYECGWYLMLVAFEALAW